MEKKTDYPMNLQIYYNNNPEFEDRMNTKKRMLYYAVAAICLLIAIFPGIVSIIPLSSLLIRIAAGVGVLYFGVSALLFTAKTYNAVSGGEIKTVAVKKFETSNEQKILTMFANEDWAGLADEPEMDNRPIQLYIDEDEVGKSFYLQVMKYHSSSDFSGASEVKVIKEPEYSKYYQIIKGIQST